MDAAQLGDLSKILLRRATISSLQHANTTDAERALMAAGTPPVTGPHAQDYVAWRRAVLWVSGIVLAIAMLIALADQKGFAEAVAIEELKVEQVAAHRVEHGQPAVRIDAEQIKRAAAEIERRLGKSNIELIDNLQYFHLFVKMVVVALVLLAARAWVRVSRSRNMARWAWVISLVVPLALAAFPWANALDFEHLGQFGGDIATVRKTFAVMFGAFYLLMLLPKLLSIFPGIMRSALTMKTLLPESMQTGWMTVLTAPLFVGFLLLILCVLSQVQGSFMVIGAFVSLAIGPCIYLYRAHDLLRPHPVEDAERIVHQIRRRAIAFNGIGITLLVIYLLDHQVLPMLTMTHMLLEAFGGVLLTMIVFSDLLLALLRFELRQSAAFAGSDLHKSYEARLAELDQTGLTDIEAALRLRDKAAAPPNG